MLGQVLDNLYFIGRLRFEGHPTLFAVMTHFKDHTDNQITLTIPTCHCEPYFGNEEYDLFCVNILLEVHGEQLGVAIHMFVISILRTIKGPVRITSPQTRF